MGEIKQIMCFDSLYPSWQNRPFLHRRICLFGPGKETFSSPYNMSFFYKGCLVKIAGKWCEIKVNSATGFGPEAIAMQLGAFCSYPRGETFFLVPSLDPNDSTVTWKYTSGSVIFTWFPFLHERGQLSSLQANSILQNPGQAIWVTRDYVCLFSTY